ncbi:hypothetical protein EDC94DRAFT_583003 [Helicostylum pulchrum]|nr:hypothetical protein EDC94DRAFT_583003 [Helicostylum pulchrum]
MKSSVLLYYIISLSNFFVIVYSDGQKDVNSCRKACSTDFLSQLVDLLNIDLTIEDYINLSPFWTACQYRCYRCSLNVGIQDMSTLLEEAIYRIDQALEDCYNEWDIANDENDNNSVF